MGFTRDTQVLTENGWMDIADIGDLKLNMQGQLVKHAGLLCMGSMDCVAMLGLHCTVDQNFLVSYTHKGLAWVSPDYLALSEAALNRAIRTARKFVPTTYACRLRADRAKPEDKVMFDISGVASYLVLSRRGALIAKPEFDDKLF